VHTLRNTDWWSGLVDRVVEEPLSLLAREFGAPVDDVEAALAELDDGDAITDTPAWPEIVRRVRDGGSLRDTARRFGTSPRRIRRGLARSAVRVSGTNLDEAGVPGLQAFSEELGKVPDGAIAEKAGVTVEAVQGERRRLGITAFRPRPAPRRRRERPTPERPPQRRPKTQKVWQREEVATQVVHRPARRKVETTERETPAMAGFAKGLRLPTLRAPAESGSPSSSRRGLRSEGSRRTEGGRRGESGRSQGLRRRVVVRNDADPIANALAEARPAEPTKRKTSMLRREPDTETRTGTRTRRRRVAGRRSSEPASDVEPAPKATSRPNATRTLRRVVPKISAAPPPAPTPPAPTPRAAKARPAVEAASPVVQPTPSATPSSPSAEVVPPTPPVAPVETSPVAPSPSPEVPAMRASPTRRSVRQPALSTVGVPAVPKIPRVVPPSPRRERQAGAGVQPTAKQVSDAPPVEASPPSPAQEAAPPAAKKAAPEKPTAKKAAAKKAAPKKPAAKKPAAKRAAPEKPTAKKAAAKKAAPKTPTAKKPAAKKAAPKKAAPKKPAAKKAAPKKPAAKKAAPKKPAAKKAVAAPAVVVPSAQLNRLSAGVEVVRDARLSQVAGGLAGPGVPEVWRVSVGNARLPMIVLAYSMVDAISIVAPRLHAHQLQKLSVWSDGPAA